MTDETRTYSEREMKEAKVIGHLVKGVYHEQVLEIEEANCLIGRMNHLSDITDKTQRFPMRDEEKAREKIRIKLYDGVKN